MHTDRTPRDLLVAYYKPWAPLETLESVIATIQREEPRFGQYLDVLKLYWGFTEEGSISLTKISKRLGIDMNRAKVIRNKAERIFLQPKWWRKAS